MSEFRFDFSATGADGSTTLTRGSESIGVTVSTPWSAGGAGFCPGSENTLKNSGVSGPATAEIVFNTPVSSLDFVIYGVGTNDSSDDKITIIALNARGDQVAVNRCGRIARPRAGGNSTGESGQGRSGANATGRGDAVTVSIAGPMVSLAIIYDTTQSDSVGDTVHIGALRFDRTKQSDSSGIFDGKIAFTGIGEIIPCFTAGTRIATPKGERPIEALKIGDQVITRDNGIQEIRWLGTKSIDRRQLGANPHLRPVLIRAGSLGNDLPERDMMVSPNQRMLIANDRTPLYFEAGEVLAAAKHLVNNTDIVNVDTVGVKYIHFMFDRHQVLLSNGAWTESFQPGDYSLNGLGNAQRTELFELYPELKTRAGTGDYQIAGKALEKHRAGLISN